MIDDQGAYMFENLDMHYTYDITPDKKGEMIDGVSTLDLILIQRHILGIEKLSSPYKLIAADVDGNGRITATDLAQLRRHVLGLAQSSGDNSWVFVPQNYEFEN